jgi:formylglycine-generating enzyme required for sulfatase activity
MTKNFAIAIGINQYNPINFRPLNYAKSDAESVRDFFQQEAQFDEVNFFADNSPNLLSRSGQPIPTYPSNGNLESFLGDRFKTPFLSSGDNCWFFFAGHGLQYNNRDYLMPIDANPREVERTGIAIDYIRERLRSSGADNVILVIDACRTEGARDGLGVGSTLQPGVITIYSCSPTQKSWEIDALKQGAFTFALLEALRFKGKENYATAERLSAYLRSRVPALCREHGKVPEQIPSIGIEPLEKQHFVLLPQCLESIDIQIDILRMKNDIYRLAFCEKNLSLAEQIWKRVSALTLGKDEEVHNMLQSITLEKQRQHQETTVRRQLEESQNQLKKAEEDHRSAIAQEKLSAAAALQEQSEKLQCQIQEEEQQIESLRSALAQAKSAAAADLQNQAEELQGLLAEEQRQKDLLVAELQEKVKLIAQTNQFLEAQIAQKKSSAKNTGNQAKCVTPKLPQDVTLDMVRIPGGQFLMGSADGEGEASEKPQHLVTVPEFWMGKYLVTQAQWRSIASLPQVKKELKPNPSHFKGDLRPVENVSWQEAIEFCARLSQLTGQTYRLPSEAEWEYACRAETTTQFYFGDTLTPELANHNGAVGETTDVGVYSPNAFGLYDMHGNVWEWCQDHWHDSYMGEPIDGSTWADKNDNDYHLLRGGSWINDPLGCRSAFRYWFNSDLDFSGVGFRVVYAPARILL